MVEDSALICTISDSCEGGSGSGPIPYNVFF